MKRAKDAPITTGEEGYDTREIVIVNRPDRATVQSGHADTRWILWVGSSYLMIWADHLEDAIEIMCDWVVSNAPGLLCDEQVEAYYREKLAELEEEEGPLPALAPKEQLYLFTEEQARAEAIVERLTEERHEKAIEYSESDTTMFGHSGTHYIASDNWGISLEEPSRAELLTFLDPKHPKLKARDPLVEVARKALQLGRDEERRVA